MSIQFQYLISIDPAGIGKSGLIVIDLNTWKIVFRCTYEAKTVSEAINNFNSIFNFINTCFESNFFVWVEDFYLSNKLKITNPLATPKLIGGLEALAKYVFNWDFETYLPGEKNKFRKQNYQGNMKLTQHEEDAWFGAQKFKEKYYGHQSFKNCRNA